MKIRILPHNLDTLYLVGGAVYKLETFTTEWIQFKNKKEVAY